MNDLLGALIAIACLAFIIWGGVWFVYFFFTMLPWPAL